MALFDLVISGGTIVDGTGAAGFAGSVAVSGDRMTVFRAGADLPDADRVIDATAKVVAPGFIDLHSHAGLMILADPRHEPKVRQGVTTEIVGVDGLSYAPLPSRADLAALIEMNAGLDGAPDIPATWDSVGDYLDRFESAVACNVGLMVGNSALRISVLGWEDVPADPAALADMQTLLADAMAAGALGISSGLDYPPGAYATTDELAALSGEAARHGGFYHTQLLALVDDAAAEGMDVTFDSYPFEWASTRLLIQIPAWVQAGGPARTKERLADRAVRDRIRAEWHARGGAAYTSVAGWADVRLGAFSRPENMRYEARSLAHVMTDRGLDAVDAVCDLLLEENLRPNQVTSGPIKPTMAPFLQHPRGMVATDSTFIGLKPSPRTYGSYPRVLGEFVREDHWLGLEEAVRKMTGAPAARLGLSDRGLLADGYLADVVVFDPATVRSNATYDEPRRFPTGIEHVLVNGVAVVSDGAHTGALPGRVVRR